ncbi:MAG: hypothetical protein FWB86_03570 [Treponema sp.]|nr:hypothetical protein [Treponema sp.]MCL2250412.1 hypothetical protein [Treponema sp.]
MRKLLFIVFICIAATVYAQDYASTERQITQSIQQNSTEYDRLVALDRQNAANRAFANLQRSHAMLSNDIKTLQGELNTLINRMGSKEVIARKLERLQSLMRQEEAMLVRLNYLRGQ